MPQFNLPRKQVTMIQMWVSVALIALALLFSFMPLIRLETSDNVQTAAEMAQEIGLDIDDIPDEVDVSIFKVISSVSLIVKVTSAAIPDEDYGYSEEKIEQQEDLEKYMKSREGKKQVGTAIAIGAAITNVFESKTMSGGKGLGVVVAFIALLATIALTFIVPIRLLISAIGALIVLSKYAKNSEDGASKVANKLPGKLSMVLTFMLFQCVIPGMAPGWGLTALCVIIILSVLLNFVASRLREYPAKQFMYLNILQGGALVAIIGFLVFFFNLIKTNVFNKFAGGYYMYILEWQADYGELEGSTVLVGLLMIVYLVLALGSAGYLDKAARRLSCTVKRETPKGLIGKFFTPKANDNNIASAICCLFVFIIATYVAGVEIMDVEVLDLKSSQEAALTGVLIGSIIMIIAEVAVIVLRKKFCADLSESEAEELMMGVAMTSEEQLAKAQQIVAEAEAKVAATEAPAEEAPAEEATEEVTK